MLGDAVIKTSASNRLSLMHHLLERDHKWIDLFVVLLPLSTIRSILNGVARQDSKIPKFRNVTVRPGTGSAAFAEGWYLHLKLYQQLIDQLIIKRKRTKPASLFYDSNH